MKKNCSKKETTISVLIVVSLVIIAYGVLWKQNQYNPAILSSKNFSKESLPFEKTSEKIFSSHPTPKSFLLEYIPQSIHPMSEAETFDAQNLSDKINGKAELYLSAEVRSLVCQRFCEPNKEDEWLEIFVYDMQTMRNAFTVYSMQKREGAEKNSLTEFSYSTSNGLYFVHGPYYVEAVASLPKETLTKAMVEWGKNFAQKNDVAQVKMKELRLFPLENMQKDSFTLHVSDLFGFDQFKQVFTAVYTIDNVELTFFLAVCSNEQESKKLAEAYGKFIVEMGGSLKKETKDVKYYLDAMESWEAVFNIREILGGIHQVESLEKAEKTMEFFLKSFP